MDGVTHLLTGLEAAQGNAMQILRRCLFQFWKVLLFYRMVSQFGCRPSLRHASFFPPADFHRSLVGGGPIEFHRILAEILQVWIDDRPGLRLEP